MFLVEGAAWAEEYVPVRRLVIASADYRRLLLLHLYLRLEVNTGLLMRCLLDFEAVFELFLRP